MAAAPTSTIEIRADGRAWIAGTAYRVDMIAAEHVAYGWSPAEIRHQHSNDLSLAQIHAALAYYYDNQVEFDALLQQQIDDLDARRTAAGEPPFVARLRSEGRLK